MEKYDEKYFTTLNYSNYLDRRDKYKKTASEVTDLLEKLSLINKRSTILDFGCAVGFLVSGLREIGYENTLGYDISEWARDYGRKLDLPIFGDLNVLGNIDLMFALDVFEHMKDEEIEKAIIRLSRPNLVVRIPSSVDGKTFHLEVSKRDPTHINCKTKKDWEKFFLNLGYKTIIRLDLFSIYDSRGVSCFLVLK